MTNGSPSFLRQGDSNVFKKYSQMKPMKREALEKLDRMACERSGLQEVGLTDGFGYSFTTVGSKEQTSEVKGLWEVFCNQSTDTFGWLAQLVRASALQAEGPRFEPATAHQRFTNHQRTARHQFRQGSESRNAYLTRFVGECFL